MAVRIITAVTGDIGAGKSTAAKILADIFSCEVLDADEIAKSFWADDDVKARAVSRWGAGVVGDNGKIILPEVSKIIFGSKAEHDFCNELIHPLVMNELETRTKNIDAVIEIPLLPEAGQKDFISKVFYVAAKFEVRAQRCKVRGWDEKELQRREKFLLPREERMKICDCIIKNDGDIYELERQLTARTLLGGWVG